MVTNSTRDQLVLRRPCQIILKKLKKKKTHRSKARITL